MPLLSSINTSIWCFNLQDLEGLERNFPVLPQNLIRRVDTFFFPFPQRTNNATFVEGLSIKEAVARSINSEFMESVRNALTMEQDTYVEDILTQVYRK